MNSAGTGSCQADAQPPSVLCVAARRKSRSLFVPYLNKFDFVLMLAQSFKDAVDTVPGETEDCVNAPLRKALDQGPTNCL